MIHKLRRLVKNNKVFIPVLSVMVLLIVSLTIGVFVAGAYVAKAKSDDETAGKLVCAS